jgi:IclR family acetate operon transcriptional repressor
MSSRAPRHPKPDLRERYRVPILDRTLDLLEALAERPGGLTLTELTELLGMPKNAVFRIVTTLVLRGYAERDEPSKIYRLSGKVLGLGRRIVGGESLVGTAAPFLKALRDATGETALLGTLSGSQGIVLDQAPSLHPVKVVVELGHAFPLLTAAPAKAILAFLPPPGREALLATIRFDRKTRRTIRSLAAYRRELDGVLGAGFALDRGEESETFVCAAAPVFDHRGEVAAAVWVSGPSDRIGGKKLDALGPRVKGIADSLSRRLGCPAAALTRPGRSSRPAPMRRPARGEID